MISYSTRLNAISSLEDYAQLTELESIVHGLVSESVDQETMAALFAIFERFPWEDGYGIFWSILHLLESCSGYESFLIQSVETQPGQFTLAMLGRLLNANVFVVDNINIISLLQQISDSPEVDERARNLAHDCIRDM